jgi:hypothetical protein
VRAAATLPFDTFRFTHRTISGRVVRLGYALRGKTAAEVDLEETIELPETLQPGAGAEDAGVHQALLGLHLAAGTSYWKTCVPPELEIENAALSEEDAAFWNRIYTEGLGEFFYRNQLDPTGRAAFPFSARPARSSPPAEPAAGPALVLWGGGKDSVVSHEVLAASGEPHDLLSIGRPEWAWIRRSAEVAGRPHHVVTRRLDPKLAAMNDAGALNGHVPVNAFLASAGALIAVLTGRKAVIASNEASASVGNAVWHGIDVNHQWSKSLEFERTFRAWLRRNLPGGPEYVSLLRPLTELRIVKAFATHSNYFDAVTSCNLNFRQSGAAARRFCLDCAKCVFVSLMARPWLDDDAYHALFGGDALADPGNLTIVEELLGLRGQKPFECVGTPEEVVAAIELAKTRGRHVPHGIMTAFAARLGSGVVDLDAVAARVMSRSDEHELTPARVAQLDAYLDRH